MSFEKGGGIPKVRDGPRMALQGNLLAIMKQQMKKLSGLRKARQTSVFIYKFLGLDPSNGELNVDLVAYHLHCFYFIPQFL